MPEHVEVLIVGAGLSGIGAAHHLQERLPGTSYAILEAREASGGTWDLFRYPGIRSDSDMYTLGYSFRPWSNPRTIAPGEEILRYVRDTAREAGIDRRIRYGHRMTGASWSTEDARWTVRIEREGGRETELTARFLLMCTGYYRYDEGYTPEFTGRERFGGTIVHPQHWPEDLDHAGRRVVVIGSGATAVTLVPAMAETAGHVTMLQRSPTWIVSLPSEDPLAPRVRRLLPARAAYPVLRWFSLLRTMLSYELSRWRPAVMRSILRRGLIRELPPEYDIETHFRPSYEPWDQRLCLVPDGDLFAALRSGRAEVVTDRIETFTETGLRLESGRELEADIIVTATGLNLTLFGGAGLEVDGQAVDLPSTMAYKGTMLSGVPNLAVTFGYTNASWTLKADLTAEYVCRLLAHMRARGKTIAVPRRDPSMPERPFLGLTSGYISRALETLPRQGARPPWRLYENYLRDIFVLRRGAIEDGVLELSGTPAHASERPAAPLAA